MDQSFLTEYNSDAAVQKYSAKTAGLGINYLLEFEYGPIYLDALKNKLKAPIGDGLRMLEFGCGVGMNLLHCLATLRRERIPVEAAYGTDFSDRLIEEARLAALPLDPMIRSRVNFLVARNEELVSRLAADFGVAERQVDNTFHFIIGVNTFRYCHRIGKTTQCAGDIYRLLKPGGVCVMIDMNNKFPAFRSRFNERRTKPKDERYIPTLQEYAAPFASAGLEILDRRNFCWIPHSASASLLSIGRAVTPVLNAVIPSFAMRSLVVSRKPL
jgi:SAM-dependent methyltransferase